MTRQFKHSGLGFKRHKLQLRNDDRTKIKINTPGGSVAYYVLTMKIREYSLEEIFDKNLLFLIPFYIFNYGSKKQLEELENNSEKLDALKKECAIIVERLDDLTDREELSVYYRQVLLEMSNKVVESLAARYEKVVKGVKDVMGGTVLEYKAKKIFNEGGDARAKEMAQGLHKRGVADEVIAESAKVSVDVVKQWLGLQKAETLTEN